MQISLFYEEESTISDYKVLTKHLKYVARNLQYLHCLVRAYYDTSSEEFSRILKGLQDVQTTSEYIHTMIEEIVAEKYLKTDNSNQYKFLSSISDEYLVVSPEYKDVVKVAKDAKYRALSALHYYYDIYGKSNISRIRESESDFMGKMILFSNQVDKIARLL